MKENLHIIKKKIQQLEDDIRLNELTVQEIREKIHHGLFSGKKTPSLSSLQQIRNGSIGNAQGFYSDDGTISNRETCEFSGLLKSKHSVDVQMLDVYESLKFDNPDGGVWKQGWNISYEESEEKSLPTLKVFVVPHSHCDPGWLKTYVQYYEEQVRGILSKALSFLDDHADMKFIYAEMSFFHPWFMSLSSVEKEKLEIVTGGWVMADEAASHYFALIDQLIEGHQFLENYLGYKPVSHWSIDPFGQSATMPVLIQLSGFRSMSIHRVHYAIKKHLARNRQLEFYWRPLWRNDQSADIFCHMFPFYSYDIPHTCGPDPRVCCQFDFPRMTGIFAACPWGINPVSITAKNVAERSRLLLDQFRKQSKLFQTRSLLVPLGDDFRFGHSSEWTLHYTNYKALFEYMNSQKDFNVKAQFGTLDDYFASVAEELQQKQNIKFPVLSGDFFTYADRDDDYWSGYFTSRPFHKALDRVLEKYLRGAEILFSAVVALSQMDSTNADHPPPSVMTLFMQLTEARRNLGIFQHHDGITGTSKTFVMVDYAAKLAAAVADCQKVIAISIPQLFSSNPPHDANIQDPELDFAEEVKETPAVQDVIISVGRTPRTVIVYNSLPYERTEVVCIKMETGGVMVTDEVGQKLSVQLSPVVKKENSVFRISSKLYEDITDVISGHRHHVKLEFVAYASEKGDSGAYLFLHGEYGKMIRSQKQVLLVDGPLFATVYSCFQQVMHAFRVIKEEEFFARAFHVTNVVDITSETVDYELAMRLKTDVKSASADRSFYTDINGLMMIRRKHFDKLQMQANVYPMVTAAFLQSDRFRFTVLSAQSSAVASPASGMLDVFLDRRSMNDDSRGLAQSLQDNVPFSSSFRLLLEDMQPSGIPTVSSALNIPRSSLLSRPFPCDYHLVNLRSLEESQTQLPSKRSALILHRLPVDCDSVVRSPVGCSAAPELSLKTDLSFGQIVGVEETTLTLMHSKKNCSSDLRLKPMELRTFKVTWN
ncbi:unnamed protein product [Soboliphyme baturini]|uniref:mannosyl-oligosaccharide 1,3-1,6-alpha-mannosidase n=1 Tax=Soboliphyme baturini TaxID=241478 RepID=A0A3P8D6M7_9BILA|nr:unnamed protein product [Soboliphyme baturini]